MNKIANLGASGYRLLIRIGSWLQPVVLLFVRLCWGWQFIQTGWGKFGKLNDVAGFFGTLGIPLPMANAILVATTELVGGVLLLIGLASRAATIPLMIILIVAYSTDDREALLSFLSNPLEPDKFLAATPFLFLFACIIIFAFGPGSFSIDYFLKRFVFDRKPAVSGSGKANESGPPASGVSPGSSR